MSNFVQSEAERKILLEKQKIRAALRADYLKQISNPHRHATGEGGSVVSYLDLSKILIKPSNLNLLCHQ